MESNSRNQVLAAVQSQQSTERVLYPIIPDFPETATNLLSVFESKLKAAGGEIFHPADIHAAQALLAAQHPHARVICSATPDITGNRDIHAIKNPQELADVDVGVIRARLGVAENGMVWLTEEDLVVNSLGFLSQHLVILLSPEQIVADMYDAYLHIYMEDTAYGCFMMGPSATADIGAVLVHGAQGARSLSVYLV